MNKSAGRRDIAPPQPKSTVATGAANSAAVPSADDLADDDDDDDDDAEPSPNGKPAS